MNHLRWAQGKRAATTRPMPDFRRREARAIRNEKVKALVGGMIAGAVALAGTLAVLITFGGRR